MGSPSPCQKTGSEDKGGRERERDIGGLCGDAVESSTSLFSSSSLNLVNITILSVFTRCGRAENDKSVWMHALVFVLV